MLEPADLYNKYRPSYFSDVVGQTTPIRVMRNALESGTVNSAYLLSGPRGTGKTSSARIFAKALLCTDDERESADGCGKCPSCESFDDNSLPDFIEIDAATNRGIENVRTIIQMVSLSPRISDCKVVLIDEVHHLTSDAATGLLKVLEEPPNNVIFLLATTHPMKLPDTIRSRCTWLRFKPLSTTQTVARLNEIAVKESFSIEEGVLQLIAKQSRGGMRDALSALDMLMVYAGSGMIKLKDAEKCFGAVEQSILVELCAAVIDFDTAKCLGFTLRNQSDDYSPKDIILAFGDMLSSALLCYRSGGTVIGHDSGFSSDTIPMIETLAKERAPRELLRMRDVIERNLWKFDNATLDQNHLFNEIMLLIISSDYDSSVPGTNAALTEKTEEVLDKVTKNMDATNALVGFIKKLLSKKDQ